MVLKKIAQASTRLFAHMESRVVVICVVIRSIEIRLGRHQVLAHGLASLRKLGRI
jgi:hypothetical protein